MISMRWLVLCASAPLAQRRSSATHAQPPGPGLPLQAPSVQTRRLVAMAGKPTGASHHPCSVPPGAGAIGAIPWLAGPMVTDGLHFDDPRRDGYVNQLPDIDPEETSEWLDSLEAVVETHGKTRARYLISKLLARANELQVGSPAAISTPYVNTIPAEREPWFPGDEHVERRLRAYIRWNATAMVVRATKKDDGIGGDLATFASDRKST